MAIEDTEKLKNIFPKDSRYYQTVVFVDDYVASGRARLGLWKAPALRTRPELELKEGDYTKHRVIETDIGRMDYISYKYYGDVKFWWVICWINGIHNPLVDMSVGDELIVPNKSLVMATVGEKSGNV